MDTLKVNLTNCYGIDTLQHEFDFKQGSVFAVYARNGLMKTSFAKTFQKIQQGKQTEVSDLIFDDAGCINIEIDGRPITPNDVFVIKSFESSYESDISSLLVNDTVKTQLKDVLKARDKFLKAIEKASGLKIKKTLGGKAVYELESAIVADFNFSDSSILMNLDALTTDTTTDTIEIDFGQVPYCTIFDATVLKKILSTEFQTNIESFISASNEVYASFSFLEKGNLTLPKLKDIKKSLEKDSFFVKDNKLILAGVTDVTDIESLNTEIASIEDTIKQMPELQAVENLLTDVKGMLLKDIIETHVEIIDYLTADRLPLLKQLLWHSYVANNRALFDDLRNKYQLLSNAIDAVKLDDTPWKHALDIFDKRFTVPFTMEIANLKGAIIGESVPQVEFSFKKGSKTKTIDRSKLEEIDTLSQGEKRALYLLNIIFDIEAIKASGEEKLLIIDDIADSFDYKNKYAIVEYLYELALESKLRLIILSHNFDFYRTISSRLAVGRENRLVADNLTDSIRLSKEVYQKQPFEFWKKHPHRLFVLALIPFVRNIVEYGKERNVSDNAPNADFLLLTSLLHEKNSTSALKFSDLLSIYQEYIGIDAFEQDVDISKPVVPAMYDICDQMNDTNSTLEYKIILSMAIRHKAEIYMIKKIKTYTGQLSWDKNKHSGSGNEFLMYVDTKGNQTRELMNGFLQIDSGEAVELISEVNIMTPENIHLNSFMYEPILDMDVIELLNLYRQITALLNQEEQTNG